MMSIVSTVALTDPVPLISNFNDLPPWLLIGSLSIAGLLAVWLCLRLLRVLPILNLLVFLLGAALLMLEPVAWIDRCCHLNLVRVTPEFQHLLPTLFVSGVVMFGLAVVSRIFILRDQQREVLRRQFWAWAADQGESISGSRSVRREDL